MKTKFLQSQGSPKEDSNLSTSQPFVSQVRQATPGQDAKPGRSWLTAGRVHFRHHPVSPNSGCPPDWKPLGKSPTQARQSCTQSSPTSHPILPGKDLGGNGKPCGQHSVSFSKWLLNECMTAYTNSPPPTLSQNILTSSQSPVANQSTPAKPCPGLPEASCFQTVLVILSLTWGQV